MKERTAQDVFANITSLTEDDKIEIALNVEIAKEIAKARREKGFTQKQLAEIAETTQPSLARLEAALVSPRVGTLIRLLRPLGKTIYIGDLQTN